MTIFFTNFITTVATKTAGNSYFNQGSTQCYFLQSSLTGVNEEAPALNFTRGNTYVFNLDHSSCDGHPLYFSSTEDGIHQGGVRYTAGVTYRLNGVAVDAVSYVASFDVATTRSVTIQFLLIHLPHYTMFVTHIKRWVIPLVLQ